ncbi:hypothetical protein BsWGS_06979 [Bradybaena similaris]
MAASGMNSGMFREVSVASVSSSRWKAITICTGASASTLQDIKVPESCGGYAYRDAGVPGSSVRNRFIYWRTYQDILELVEESLDLTLSGNLVRYRFQDTPTLPKVTVHESHGSVVVLVATVASVHRLVFPHPNQLTRQQTFVLSEQNASSIFYDASLPDDPKNQVLLTPGGSINSHLLGGASCVCHDGHALFVLATNTGGLLIVKMPPVGVSGVVLQQELSCSSVMKKLWNGIIPGALRASQPAGETAVSLELMSLNGEIFVFTVCRDFRLRVWSVKSKDCVFVENLLDYTSEELDDAGTTPVANSSGHVIKAVLGENTSDLCAYLSLQNKAKFVFLTPVIDNGRIRMEHVTTLDKSPPEDLVDFVVTEDYLMSLWTTQAGDTQVLTTSLAQPEASLSSAWEPVVLAAPLDFVVVPQNRDPRDVYLERIFAPGLFAPQDIMKALSVYRRRAMPSVEVETLYNMASLKEEVSNAVDSEIRNIALEDELPEVSEDNFVQLQHEQWEKFYSGCCQYKQVRDKAKGLTADPVTGLFCIIKKSTFSVLRPCDKTEELYLSPTIRLPVSFIERAGFIGEDVSPVQFADDVRLVCDAVQFINSRIPPDVACMFLSCLQSLQPPEELVEKLQDMIRTDQEATDMLVRRARQMTGLVPTMEALFSMLEFRDLTAGQMEEPEAGHQHYSNLFSGNLALSILTQSFQQLVSLRFEFVRDITVFLVVVSSLKERAGLEQSVKDNIMNDLLPKGVDLLRCYKVLVWASQALTTVSPNSVLDQNLRQLSTLEITDISARTTARPSYQTSYVVQMFLEGVGGEQIRHRLASISTGSVAVWRDDLIECILGLGLLIWPATDDTIFPEYLVRACQYLRLQEYVQLLTPWCNWSEGSCAFFLGLSYLHFHEVHKAVRLFVDASDGVATETFLSQKLLQTKEMNHYRLQTLYYLKVIRQLEEHNLPDLVITMAIEAINKADKDDPNLPALQSKIFKHHLELGHNQQAFHAMMNNPDADRKKDCLRQFLVVLSERGDLADLVSFDYQELEEEVVYILENRARSVDLLTYDYYSLLYSYFIYREDYRKAGRIMFEQGLRLSQEVPGLKSLQQQAQCYLSTLNTLRLVRPEYAWIVKPETRSARSQDGARDRRSRQEGASDRGSRQEGSDNPRKRKLASDRKMEILELSDLEKQYLLLDARLRLMKNQPDTALISGPAPLPEELLSLLCSAGLYDLAVSVTQTFSLSPEPVLSSLTLRCVTLAVSASSYTKTSGLDSSASAWTWLRENNIPPCGAREITASDQAWSLLQSYLSRLEDGSGVCHKCVAFTLLSQSFPLPTWLVHSYKALDMAALLRIYLTFDMLPHAASLATEYLEVLMHVLNGSDSSAFNLKGLDRPFPMSIWVPYTCLDQLLVALREQDNPTYNNIYQDVKQKLDLYQDKVTQYTADIRA